MIWRREKASSWRVEAGSSFGGLSDLLELDPELAPLGTDAQPQVRVAEDRSEQIVEIVRNATGELSHGLYFLRMVELLLEYRPVVLGPSPLQ